MAGPTQGKPVQREPFSDTWINESLAERPGQVEPSRNGLHTGTGFQRVVDGNAFSGPHHARRTNSRTWRYALVVLVAAVIALCRTFRNS